MRRDRDVIGFLRFDRLWRHALHWATIVPLRATQAPRMVEMAINTGAQTLAPEIPKSEMFSPPAGLSTKLFE
jgi:hypothetical protein